MKYPVPLLLLCCLGWFLSLATNSGAQAARRFTVRDSIEMATFSLNHATGRSEDVQFSRDGRYFFVVTTRGNLKLNQRESTIWLFDTGSVKAFLDKSLRSRDLRPRPLTTMAGPSNHDQVNDDSIVDARWAQDGQSIIFLGRHGSPERHLYALDVENRKLRQLSLDGQDVKEFEECHNIFVYAEVEPVSDSHLYNATDSTLPDIQIAAGRSLDALLFPKWQEVLWEKRPRRMWMVRRGKTSPVIDVARGSPLSLRTDWFGALCSISPSGRYVVIRNYALRVPRAWESYQPAYESPETKIIADEPGKDPSFDATRPQQYELVDLQTGNVSVLVDAPLGRVAGYGYSDKSPVAWSPNEQVLALPNTFLPLDRVPSPSPVVPKRPCIVVIDLQAKEEECVEESPLANLSQGPAGVRVLKDLQFRDGDQKLVAQYSKFEGEDLVPEVFERNKGHWRRVSETAVSRSFRTGPLTDGILVSVGESINVPPVLTASAVGRDKPTPIWNPNPQFDGIDLGHATLYRWRGKTGEEWTGGLVKPPDYVPGKRYPLVIQTHGFNPNVFLVDGFSATANAARPLAARGILVLQVGEVERHFGTPAEAELDGKAAYLSAIEQLAAEGLIDRNRVGIIGFSHTGWYVLESLIDAPEYFAAASLAEFSSASYWQYLLSCDFTSSEMSDELADEIGSKPFGSGLKQWLAVSPGFNTDKIAVPMLLESNYPTSLINYWDLYASLRLQGKPAELLYMRSGDHVLTKPLEQFASQEMNVDWYDFWLNGHEDPDPAKVAQYVRWRRFRAQDESTNHHTQ